MADTPQMGGFVAVKTAGGVQMLPPSEAADLILAGEAEQASAEDIRRNYMRDDPGLAAMLGAARGATVGLSDIALSSAGLDHEAQQEYAQENPTASTLGEIGGIAGSMLLPGGGLVGQTARVGGAVGKAMLPRLPRLGKLVQAAGEGATLSGAMGAAEAVIDPEKTAADVLEQAAWGGAIGAGIGAASLGIGRLAKFARKEVQAEVAAPDAKMALEQARQRSELSKLRAENEAILKEALGEEAPLELLSRPDIAGLRVKVSEAEFQLAEKRAIVKELEQAAYGRPAPRPAAPEPLAGPPEHDALYRQLHEHKVLHGEMQAEAKRLQEMALGRVPAPEPVLDPAARSAAEIERIKLSRQLRAATEARDNVADDLFGLQADTSRALSPQARAAISEQEAGLEATLGQVRDRRKELETALVGPGKKPPQTLAEIQADRKELEAKLIDIRQLWDSLRKKERAARKSNKGKLSDKTRDELASAQADSGEQYAGIVARVERLNQKAKKVREWAKKEALRTDDAALAKTVDEYATVLEEELQLSLQSGGLSRQIKAANRARQATDDALRIAARSADETAALESGLSGRVSDVSALQQRIDDISARLKAKPAEAPLAPEVARQRLDELLPKLRASEERMAALRSGSKQPPKAMPEGPPAAPRFTPEQARAQLPSALSEADSLSANIKELKGRLSSNDAVQQRLAEMAKRGSPDDALNRWAANEVRIRELDSILGPAAAEKASALSAAMSKMGGSVLARIIAGSIGHAIGGPVGAAAGWVVAPKIASRVLDAVGGRAAPVVAGATRLGDMANKAGQFVGKVGRPLKPAAITMTAREFAELRDELQATEPGQMEAEALAAMPSNMDPGIGAKVVAQSVGRVEYLRSIMPQQQQTLGNYLQPTQEQLDSFARSIRAVIDPNSVHDDFAQGLEGKGGGVSKEAIAAAELLDGDTLARLRAVTEATLWRRKTNTLHQQQQIARYLGRPEMVEAVFAPHTALAMANIQGEQKPPPKAPGRPSKLGDRHMTDLERISTGEKA